MGLWVFAGLVAAVPLLVAREFGWYLVHGRQLEDPGTVARVTVFVVDALTDGPLQGIRTWGEGEGPSARTDASGRAELVLSTGATLLVAGGRGQALAGRVVDLPPGDSEQVFRLLPAEELTGRVELPDGGAAAGASITATPLEWPALGLETPNADEAGRFLVPRPVPGSWRLEASLEGEGRAVALVRAPDEEILLRLGSGPLPDLPGAEPPPDQVLAPRPGGKFLTVRGPDGGVVAGALVLAVEADGGSPGAGMRRGQLPLLCATDHSGRCELPEDAGCVFASAAPHADSETRCAGGDLQLREGHVLSGQATLPGAGGGWVTSSSGPVSAVGRDGRFALGPLPAGTEQLTLHGGAGTVLGNASVTVPVEGEWEWPAGTSDSAH
jgi:hypothetical protein